MLQSGAALGKGVGPLLIAKRMVIYDLLRPHIKPSLDLFIRLYETPRNFVEYPA